MTDVKLKGSASCTAPAETIFDLLERDHTEFHNDELRRVERLGDAPFGPGYRTKSTIVHSGELCTSETRITVCERPRVLHEEWVHHCKHSKRTLTGGWRYEILEDDTGTLVVCEIVRRKPGLDGLLESLFGSFSDKAQMAAAYLAMRAEALALSGDQSAGAVVPAP